MTQSLPISRVTNLIPEASQRLWTTDESEGRRRLLASDMGEVVDFDVLVEPHELLGMTRGQLVEALPALGGMTVSPPASSRAPSIGMSNAWTGEALGG